MFGRYELAAEHFSEAVEAQDRIGPAATVVHTRLERHAPPAGPTRDTRQDTSLLEEALAGARSVAIPALAAKATARLASGVS